MSLNNDLAFEIDFLPVGKESKSGDAIAMRWGNQNGFWVAVIDGGTQESGERLVHHVRNVYGAHFINLAVNTHPDGDHSSGLSVVLDLIRVEELWMHRPWFYPGAIRHLFRDGRFTTQGLSGSIRKALDCANELERIAIRRGVRIVEPFQGLATGPLMVLSPSLEEYLKLIPHFNNTPEPLYRSPLEVLAGGGALTGSGIGLAYDPWSGGLGLADLAQAIKPRKKESWANETLGDNGITTEQNESSVVLYARFNGVGMLLTGDAGHMGLFNAWRYAWAKGIDLSKCTYYQVPHHGSRRNVSPAILDLMLGPKYPYPVVPSRWAVASVAAGAETHPRKAVVNAFLRRGVGVHVTRGSITQFSRGYGARSGWIPAPVMPLSEVVDD
jgi:beta-lactamase superfamily II metal-dependent hydrolase